MVCAHRSTQKENAVREEYMQRFKLILLVLGVFMVLGFGAFLVPKPNTGAKHFADALSRQTVQASSCIPNDTQWTCQ